MPKNASGIRGDGLFLTEDREASLEIRHQRPCFAETSQIIAICFHRLRMARQKPGLLGNLVLTDISRFVPLATFCENAFWKTSVCPAVAPYLVFRMAQ
jgi:hypothetical protein